MNEHKTQDVVVIREAADADLPAIQKLAGQMGYSVTEKSIRRHLAESKKRVHAVLVADSPDRGVIGWVEILPRDLIVCDPESPRAEIGGVVVEKAFRRKGIGRKLLEHAEQWCWRAGYRSIIIRSNVTRDEAHKFYKETGYRVLKTQTIYTKER